jgi:hypothetical protein
MAFNLDEGAFLGFIVEAIIFGIDLLYLPRHRYISV